MGIVDCKKILEEIQTVSHTGRQTMLQTVAGCTDPKYGIGKVKELNHNEEAFIEPLYELPYLNDIMKSLGMYRTRIMKMPPLSTYSYHKDFTPRIHIPLITHENCFMVLDDEIYRYPVGYWYLVDTTKFHTFVNASTDCLRIHIVGCVNENYKD